jgi:uncharacterized protein (DUF1684 family)
MRALCTLLSVLVGLTTLAQSTYIDKIESERQEINRKFGDPEKSILTKEDQKDFHGLHFYEVDSNYRVEARFKKRKGRPFEMQTSTSRLPIYQKYGVLKFSINGEKCKLYVYKPIKPKGDTTVIDYVFCPFKDASNADSSYGGGRYLDFKIDELNKTMYIDFNTCYNPYCAYNNRYSCPIPPDENWLSVRIDAGVKKWHD